MQTSGTEAGSAMDAGRAVLELAEGLLASGQSLLVETTLSGNTYLRMMRRAKELGYQVNLLFVGTAGVSINLQRVELRVRKGGHDVPEADQLRRYPRSMANFERAFALADEANVFDNSTAKGHRLVAVKTMAGGLELFEPVPDWAKFLLKLAPPT